MPPKKGKGKGKDKAPPPGAPVKPTGPPPKPKKPPPPPATFTNEDIMRFKEMFKLHDEENIDKVPIELIPLMLRKLGFNPKTAEIKQLYLQFLEDDLVDTVELHEWYFMIEAKINWGDDFEAAVTESMKNLGHDDDNKKIVDFELLKEELQSWGEPLSEIEFSPMVKLSTKDKTFTPDTGLLQYEKFIENMIAKDARFFPEPINFFKLDQKTLAEMAIKKAQEEREEAERKDAEKRAREEARRLRMIADGLLPPD